MAAPADDPPVGRSSAGSATSESVAVAVAGIVARRVGPQRLGRSPAPRGHRRPQRTGRWPDAATARRPAIAVGGGIDSEAHGSDRRRRVRRPGDPADRPRPRATRRDRLRRRARSSPRRPSRVEGPFLDDGTLLKPVAVDTTVADGADLVETYKVKSGDTLTGIADKFDVSMMTLWWANKLKSKDDLHHGQVLTHPAGHRAGRHRSRPTDTLDSLATQLQGQAGPTSSPTNGIDDPNLVVGQVLVMPGRARAADPDAEADASRSRRPTTKPRSSGGGVGPRPPATYSGGSIRCGRSSAAATTSASTTTTATTASTSPPTTGRASAPRPAAR